MKLFYFALILCFSATVKAQDSIAIAVKAPKIVTNLKSGKAFSYEDVEVKFIKVISDSRCPKDVTCVWAGKAEVLVSILKQGKVLEQKTITITPYANLKNPIVVDQSSAKYSIEGVDLLPYPVSTSKTKPEDYVLQLHVID
ncbi:MULTISPECIES: hypothetical protein [Mesoflavibacter]|uniref:Uncharacterized protein n=1 Tax=Mesoflavibacter profundi TaxID=2708110 RepID=A0ABT4S187_9FLAO|nr:MULTISPECIES: hypothetical protein [Mesoflavibacter]MDA0177812.1 hypothetical protein [Mesoflavibacter profundi]QIJ88772.1 hypothetical protein C7H62_0963 [Mesoflavibacter sp. HG96]QIJ91500.1 hypothetical protein C7H56_0963 [Mesoflavibacter sp. HG37]